MYIIIPFTFMQQFSHIIPTYNNRLTLFDIKSRIRLNNLSLYRFLIKLSHWWVIELNSIYRRNIFLCSSFLISFVLKIIQTSKLSLVTVSFVAEIFPENDEKYGFVIVHTFAKQGRDEHLRMVGEHYLLLYAASCEGTTSD